VEYPIVGIKAFGSSLLVATTGNPFVLSGSNPEGMSQERLPIYEPCVSKRSMVSDEGGAQYASPNGIVRIGPGFAGNSIRNLFTREEWQKYRPESMLGTILDGSYYLFYQADGDQRGALIFDRNQQASPLTTSTLFVTAAFAEPESAALHVAIGGRVHKWEASETTFLPYEWKSKLFIVPRPVNFGAGQIDADFDSIELAEALRALREKLEEENRLVFMATEDFESTINSIQINGGLLNGSLLQQLPFEDVDQRYVTLTVFCQGKQVAVVKVRDRRPFRLPSGFRGDRWEFQLTGNLPMRHLKIAETSTGLVNL
jgi:hypothetical protein